jgi:dienelactone hydrolase
MSRAIEYSDGDAKLCGLLAEPSATSARAAVLVCHEGPGFGPHVKRRTQMLAELGYSAFALDMFGDGSPLIADPVAMRERMTPWLEDRVALRRRAQAGLDALRRTTSAPNDTLLAIGYCFGGTTVLELARAGAALNGVFSFHGGLKTPIPATQRSVKARILSCVGAEDPLIPIEDRNAFEDEMKAAGASWQTMLFSGAEHSFTNRDVAARPGFSYNAWADGLSWSAMQAFFDGVLDQ